MCNTACHLKILMYMEIHIECKYGTKHFHYISLFLFPLSTHIQESKTLFHVKLDKLKALYF